MLDTETYVQRRERLIETLDSGLVLLLGHDESPMNYAGNPYPFRQESSFLYYFGHCQPGLAGLIDVEEGLSVLFGDDATLDEVIWTGPQPSLSERGAEVGVEDCRAARELADQLSLGIQAGRAIHFLPPARDSSILKLARLLEIPSSDVARCASREMIEAVVGQRSIKSDEEVAEIEQALELTHAIHTLAMRMARPGLKEQEVVGAIEGTLGARGSSTAFPIIFTVRGEILHHHAHDNQLEEGDLALLDAGANSPSFYASDITRTFPVGGSFSERQRQIYDIVLAAQAAAIEALAPEVKYEDLHLLAASRITSGLVDLGLMKGKPEDAVEAGAHALFFPHGLGHMMGLDVHDMESLGEDHVGYDEDVERSSQFGRSSLRLARRLQAGFVLTVEPGIYFIPPLIDQWRGESRLEEFIAYEALEDWRDFGGIRIEDDLLVTAEGSRLLGEPIPKSIDEVEALCSA